MNSEAARESTRPQFAASKRVLSKAISNRRRHCLDTPKIQGESGKGRAKTRLVVIYINTHTHTLAYRSAFVLLFLMSVLSIFVFDAVCFDRYYRFYFVFYFLCRPHASLKNTFIYFLLLLCLHHCLRLLFTLFSYGIWHCFGFFFLLLICRFVFVLLKAFFWQFRNCAFIRHFHMYICTYIRMYVNCKSMLVD